MTGTVGKIGGEIRIGRRRRVESEQMEPVAQEETCEERK